MRDEGTYLSGRALTEPPRFLIGAVENPFAPPRDFRPMRLGTKIEAGAEFIQTQICFNLDAMCGYLPTTNQVQQLVLALERASYEHLETFEVLHRSWHVTARSVRPDQRMVAHTGFVTIARRI